ncbi:MAG TPA: PASTA domain-containing protein [Solirubrobacteraceae bacterium]|nr:PASTA domain-containing protein [Solirubrobacteraceae bacterium]
MSNPQAQRERQSPRGKLHRPLRVSEYVGQSAAAAAQAIRRAGLRPGLERSLGCEPEAIGHVLEQDPPAGSELARNALVTLYVGAPGPAPGGEQPDEQPAQNIDQPPQQQVEHDTQPAAREPHAPSAPRRRRKPRPQIPAPAPAAPAEDPEQQWISSEELTPQATATHAESSREEPVELERDRYLEDELVTHAENVLAGRSGACWRSVYPSRRRLARATAHPQPQDQHDRRSIP